MTFDPSTMRYGADDNGLVCGFLFSEHSEPETASIRAARGDADHRHATMRATLQPAGQPGSALQGPAFLHHHDAEEDGLVAHPVDATQALAWLADFYASEEPQSHVPPRTGVRPKDFLWLHFHLAHTGSRRWIEEHLDLPEAFFEALQEGSRSTRIEQQDGSLLAVVNDVTFSFEQRPTEIATLWVYTHRRMMVTLRVKPLRSVDRLRASVMMGERFRTPAELLVHLLRDQADLMAKIVRDTSADVDGIEDQLLAQRPVAFRQDLGGLRRILVRLQRTLAPEPGSLFRLLARPPGWLQHQDVQDLRESTEEFSLVLGDPAGLIERIRLIQEDISVRRDEQSNRTLFTLTMVTVLALPINIVAGFFGMNVGGVPLSENKHGFWLLVLLVVTFTAVGGMWAFRGRNDR
ncbi:transporter [Robbsia andropogonis]|uniref:transporter n=1 Tax=Robbsia andropogonis TaxID=28092 RepID=UPI002A6A6315|nr:transporter [Robbsia andropogonis]